MPKYNLYAGLGGGFGGASYHTTKEYGTADEAETEARALAIEEYESYEGSHGILSEEDITAEYCEENGIEESKLTKEDKDAIENNYMEAIESWIDYCAVLAVEDLDSNE